MFVSPIDIQNNRYIINTKTTLTKRGFDTGRKIPPKSICFVCIGSTIGKIAQITDICITNQQINSIVPFLNIKLSIPSLPEQEKIANFLSSIDKKLELVEGELEKNKEFKKGLLQQMFV